MPSTSVPGRVSVIIPAYNRAALLPAAIDSALAQTHPDVEIIVIDDGSTDATSDIMFAYSGRIIHSRQTHLGRTAARNAGLRMCSGEFVVFLDSDDLLLPHKIESQLAILRARPSIDIVYGNGYTLNEEGVLGPLEPFVVAFPPENPHAFWKSLMRRNLFAIHAALVRRGGLPAFAPFDESLTAMEDWDLWVRMVLRGSRVAYEDDKNVVYRRHAGNMDVADAGQFQVGLERVVMKVVDNELDVRLPLEIRREFRLMYLRVIARHRSVPGVLSALAILLLPVEGRTNHVWRALAVSLIRPGSVEQCIVGAAIVALLRGWIPSPVKRFLRRQRWRRAPMDALPCSAETHVE